MRRVSVETLCFHFLASSCLLRQCLAVLHSTSTCGSVRTRHFTAAFTSVVACRILLVPVARGTGLQSSEPLGQLERLDSPVRQERPELPRLVELVSQVRREDQVSLVQRDLRVLQERLALRSL